MRFSAALAVYLILSVGFVVAQSPEKVPEFEAVSVKLSTGADHGPPGSDGGPGTKFPEWFGANSTIRSLVSRAYGLINGEKQVSGPSWIDGQQFAIDARVPLGTTKEQFQKMLQKLLVERFGFVAHQETTVLPVFELVVAKTGPKLKAAGELADAPLPPDFPDFPGTGMLTRYSNRVAHLRAREQTMASLARQLSGSTVSGRTVIDKTGLTGKYDFLLQYEPESQDGSRSELGIGLFEALPQQLGLRLADAKQNVEMIVIDHVEKIPTEN